jgi:hypothetical protein
MVPGVLPINTRAVAALAVVLGTSWASPSKIVQVTTGAGIN